MGDTRGTLLSVFATVSGGDGNGVAAASDETADDVEGADSGMVGGDMNSRFARTDRFDAGGEAEPEPSLSSSSTSTGMASTSARRFVPTLLDADDTGVCNEVDGAGCGRFCAAAAAAARVMRRVEDMAEDSEPLS